jgi:hypothetical protein
MLTGLVRGGDFWGKINAGREPELDGAIVIQTQRFQLR